MFPFDERGGILHLRPSAAERVAYLVLDTGPAGEPLTAAARDPRLFPALRVGLLPNGWVRALVSRDIGDERVLADVLFAPNEVLAIHNEWPATRGPGFSDTEEAAPVEERTRRWEESWQSLTAAQAGDRQTGVRTDAQTAPQTAPQAAPQTATQTAKG